MVPDGPFDSNSGFESFRTIHPLHYFTHHQHSHPTRNNYQPTPPKLRCSQQCTAMYLTHRVLAPACLLWYTNTEFSLSLSPLLMMLRETMQYQRSVSHVDVQKSIGTCIWGILCPLKDQAPYRIHSLSDDDRESNHAKSIWGLVWSMNTTIHEMTSTNYKRSKTQQKERRKRNMRRKIIKIVNGQSQKKYKGSNAPESLCRCKSVREEREHEYWNKKYGITKMSLTRNEKSFEYLRS